MAVVFDPTRPKELFFHEVPRTFLEALCLGTVRAYKAGYAQCYRNCHPDLAKRRWGFCRKYDVDDSMLRIGQDFVARGATVTSKVEAADHQGEQYTLVTWGAVVKIIQAKVNEDGGLPRQAKFRDGYATEASLFPQDDPGDRPLFAVFTHRPAYDSDIPEFAKIVFPSRDGTTVVDYVDLVEMFPHVFRPDAVSVQVDGEEDRVEAIAPIAVVPDDLPLPLRTTPKTGDA